MCKSVKSPSDKKEKKLFQRQCTVQTIHTIIILEFDLRSSQHPAKNPKFFFHILMLLIVSQELIIVVIWYNGKKLASFPEKTK